MSESLFDIFGDSITKQALKNVSRQPLPNAENMGKKMVSSGPLKPFSENMGKMSSSGPIKPNESVKKGEQKKSFLSNTGKALGTLPSTPVTPMRQVFTPRAVNVGSLIYSDVKQKPSKEINYEELQFTKPSYKLDNFHTDALDYLPMPHSPIQEEKSPPNTPPPTSRQHAMEFNCSYQDEFFTDDFSNESVPDHDYDDLDLPDIY